MIVEKPLSTPSNEPHQQHTHVFYASMPEPQLNVDELSRQFDSGMNMTDLPPSYDDALEQDPSKVQAPADRDSKRSNPAVPGPSPRPISVFHANVDAAADRHVSFHRPVPESVPRSGNVGAGSSSNATFDPLVLHSKSKKLEDGFFAVPPPTDLTPHPFVIRDVQETDWKQFLVEIRDAANAQHSKSGATAGQANGTSSSPNLFQSLGMLFRSISSDRPSLANHVQAGSVVDLWNERFFKPRGLDIVLAKGSVRLSGDKRLPPPDMFPQEDVNVRVGDRGPGMPGGPFMGGGHSQMPRGRGMGPHHPHHHEHVDDSHGHHYHQRDGKHHRRSSSSSSSDSDSDSDSDFDSRHGQNDPRTRGLPNTTVPTSSSCPASSSFPAPYDPNPNSPYTYTSRKAARHQRRMERHQGTRAERRERRMERKMARRARKVERWERRGLLPVGGPGASMGMRPGMGIGMGMGPMMARGGHMGLGMGMGMGRGGFGLGVGRHYGPQPLTGLGMIAQSGGPGMGRGRAMRRASSFDGYAPIRFEEDGYFRLIVSNAK